MQRFLSGPCGKLEAELWLPEAKSADSDGAGPEPRAAAIVCHPHPRFGGTMENTAVFRIARALRRAGCAVLRFNFRGVGASDGVAEGSEVEVEDARAALDHLAAEFPGLKLWGAGFSFGARTVAALAADDARLERVVLVALPSKAFDCAVVAEGRAPGLILLAENDEFGNLVDLNARFPALPSTLETTEIPATDHFFRNRTPELEERVHDYALRALGSRT